MTRQEKQRNLRKAASLLRAKVDKALYRYEYRGCLSDLSMVVGVKPKCGHIHIPFDGRVLVFRKSNAPSQATIAKWNRWMRKADVIGKKGVALQWFACHYGTTIGNQWYMERGQGLAARGLLDRDEVEFLKELEDFWSKNPTASSGLRTESGITVL